MRILITGITGFVGGHLADALRQQKENKLFGLGRTSSWPDHARHLAGDIPVVACDLCQRTEVDKILKEVRPERIYHLAGYAHVGRSFQEPDATWEANLTATRSLYDAIVRWGERPRILYVSSGMVYGEPEQANQAFDERCVLRPNSPYGASKAAADLASFQYAHTFGLPIVRARPFNHIGPGQSADYATAHFAKQVAAISLKLQPPLLETGNLEPRRDLTDVRDIARAYVALMEKGRPGEAYNIGTGQTHSMREVVDHLLRCAGVKAEVRQRPDLVRSREVPAFHADTSKLKAETGWVPAISLEQTLKDTLDYWRSCLARDS